MIRCIPALAGALMLAGCVTAGNGPPPPPATAGATFCQVAKPILWSASDTRTTKEQADTHNRTGKRLCGWGTKG